MIKDQDIEIDGLLRRLAKQQRETATSAADHIDADEISVFAENALPEKAKLRVMSHLADCDRCRTILSNLIVLRREDEAEEPETQAGAAVSIEIPWYNKLFSIRNLAAAMGVLVLALGGFFVISLFSNLTGNEQVASLSNSNDGPSAANVAMEPFGADSSNSNSVVAESNSEPSNPDVILETEANQEGYDLGGRSQDPARSPLPRELSAERDERSMDADRQDDKNAAPRGNEIGEIAADRPAVAASQPSAPPPPAPAAAKKDRVATQAAPQNDGVAKRKTERLDVTEGVAAEEKETTLRMRVENKNFSRRGGVWYDSAYRNQPTTNIRRATPQYRSLDSGLRKITDKLKGTVVVVWKTKAYRID